MNAIRRALALVAGLALVLMLGACDSDDCKGNATGANCPPPPPPVTTPTPGITRVIDTGLGPFPALVALMRPLATTELGSFDATVDWTLPANDIDVFLMRGNCTFAQLVADQCAVIVSATGTTGKQERIRAANQPAGAYTFVVVNFGPGDESIAYQVLFTPGTSAASATQDDEASSLEKEPRLQRGLARLE